jgi:hypothetical protein
MFLYKYTLNTNKCINKILHYKLHKHYSTYIYTLFLRESLILYKNKQYYNDLSKIDYLITRIIRNANLKMNNKLKINIFNNI